MTFTAEQEAEGRGMARERLARGSIYWNPTGCHGSAFDPSRTIEHTEDTLWPYCVPVDAKKPPHSVRSRRQVSGGV